MKCSQARPSDAHFQTIHDLKPDLEHYRNAILFNDCVDTGDTLANVQNLLTVWRQFGRGLPEALAELYFLCVLSKSDLVG